MKKLSFVFLMNTFVILSQIQPVIPPSPTASALGKYVGNTISNFTGTPDISIPLYTIKLKDLSLPISLSYNPQEISVNNLSSNVGLGWSLNAGGVITRVIRDVPDDDHQDFFNPELEYQNASGPPHPADVFPLKKYGYLYAISESKPLESIIGTYSGTSTYNLDLLSIYNNRKKISPETETLKRFGIPLWNYKHWGGTASDITKFESRGTTNSIKWLADKEPDVFYFNFGSHSGKFVFDVEHGAPQIKTIPYQDLKIDYNTDNITKKITDFTVTDSKGVIYMFKDVEVTEMLETKGCTVMNRYVHNSSWYLSEIITPLGEKLHFKYKNELILDFKETIIPDWVARSRDDLKASELNFTMYDPTTYMNNTKKIELIYNDNINIRFKDNHVREDLPNLNSANAITTIEVSSSLQRIKTYELKYDYFLSSEDRIFGSCRKEHHGNKRLRLKSVQEFDTLYSSEKLEYKFEYNYYDQGSQYLTYKEFPNRFSFNLDLWGYANGASNITSVPSLNIYPDNYPKGDVRMFSIYNIKNYKGRHFVSIGGDRKVNKDYLDIGVLTKITYPTKGSTQYKYEPHSFIMDGEEYIGGGLRIKSIIKFDGENEMKYNYKYTNKIDNNVSSGKIVSLPMFASLPGSADITKNENLPTYEKTLKSLSSLYSTSVFGLGRISGSNVGYTNVIEYRSNNENVFDNGWIEYKYSFPAEFGDYNDAPYHPAVDPDGDCSVSENGICDDNYRSTRIYNFFMAGDNDSGLNLDYYPSSYLSYLTPPNPNYNWNRGLLLYKKQFNSINELIIEEKYSYKNYYPSGANKRNKVYGLKMAEFNARATVKDTWSNPGDGRLSFSFRIAKYEILTDVAKVISSKIVTNFTNDSNIVATSNYFYENTDHLQPTRIETTNSKGELLKTETKYAHDVNNTRLINENRIAIPLESKTYKKLGGNPEVLLSNKKTIYSDNHNSASLYLPSKIQASKGSSALEDRVIYHSYDDKGNPTEVSKKDGTRIVYIWGYNKTQPIAKIENATLINIASNIITSLQNLSNLDKDVVSENTLRTALNTLRGVSTLSKSQITTFTYNPLIGVTSITDPRGKTIYYEYDSFNRLQYLKDTQKNILKENKYNYKN